MTSTQLRNLAAAVPADLGCPEAVGTAASRALVAERWPTLPALDRFVVVRMFGRSADRAAVEPCMMLLRQWGVPIRDVIRAMTDPDVREVCFQKLSYANRHGT